jgi:hypothetical protein
MSKEFSVTFSKALRTTGNCIYFRARNHVAISTARRRNADKNVERRSCYSAFNTASFLLRSKGSYRNQGGGSSRLNGPGVKNFERTLAREVPIREVEMRTVEFAAKFYDIFNHTQFSASDIGGQFNISGLQVNSTHGQYNARQTSRIVAQIICASSSDSGHLGAIDDAACSCTSCAKGIQ